MKPLLLANVNHSVFPRKMGSFFPPFLNGSGFAEGEEAPSPELTLGSRDASSPVQKLGILNFLPILQVSLANSGHKEPKGGPSSLHKAFGH